MSRVAASDAVRRAEEIYAEILARAPEHDFDPKLDRVAAVTELLGDPQNAYRVVHIAGTNGKTSSARMAASLIAEHGLRVGLFTSPHLSTVRERIQIDGEPISPEAFAATWDEVRPVIDLVDARSASDDGPRLSFFEVLTVMAFVAFANSPIDVAVVEVGMGGRWDATNVVSSDVQVITPIALDHTRWLGDTVEEIAGEKAGIVRSRAVIGLQPVGAARVIGDAVAERGAEAWWAGVDFDVAGRDLAVGGQLLTLRGLGGVYTDVFLPLHGEHQAANAAMALAAVELLMADGAALAPDIVQAGFAAVTSPGRMELVRSSPAVLVDAAHNPAGAETAVTTLAEAFAPTKVVGLFAAMADKEIEAMLGVYEPVFDEIVVTRSSSPRSASAEDVGEIAIDVFGEDRVHVVDSLDEALVAAVDLAEAGDELAGMVLATGSVVLAADVRILLGKG